MESLHPRRPSEHVVTFYATNGFLTDQIATFIADGLAAGERVLAIVINAHWADVAGCLDQRGVAYARAIELGQLVVVDAEAVLEHITADGHVSTGTFRDALGALLKSDQPTRMYGELVGLLTARGDVQGAAAIEAVVHESSRLFQVPILCGYRQADGSLTPADARQLKELHDRSFAEAGIDARETAGHFHAVRFYKDALELSRIVGDFLAEGLRTGERAALFVTPFHRTQITEHLHASGFDVARLQSEERLTILDAGDVLAQFMIDGMPDRTRFRRTMDPALEGLSRDGAGRKIRVYGEMVDMLWQAGHTVAAVRLEMLWNELANAHAFSLLCGYSMGHFYKGTDVADVCAHHTHVVAQSGVTAPVQQGQAPAATDSEVASS